MSEQAADRVGVDVLAEGEHVYTRVCTRSKHYRTVSDYLHERLLRYKVGQGWMTSYRLIVFAKGTYMYLDTTLCASASSFSDQAPAVPA